MQDFSQINTELSRCFVLHLSAINDDISSAELNAMWQDIAVHYNDSQRAYHTLRHIQQLFVQFEQIVQYLYEPHIVALALYYHDIIYVPIRSDNELKSAEYAVQKLSHYLSGDQCQQIYDLIMMTAAHQLDELTDQEKRSDAAYLLDMDLSVLGMPWSEYEQYAKAVRQEYAHVSDTDYQNGRTHVLNQLLAHPTLYLTDYYHTQLETQARENIQREIHALLRPHLDK